MLQSLVRQLFSATHKPNKRQMVLESSDSQRHLRDWDRLFLKEGIFYHCYTLNDTTLQLVLPEIYRDIAFTGLHDDLYYIALIKSLLF